MKYLFGNQKTPMKWQSCTIYIYILKVNNPIGFISAI